MRAKFYNKFPFLWKIDSFFRLHFFVSKTALRISRDFLNGKNSTWLSGEKYKWQYRWLFILPLGVWMVSFVYGFNLFLYQSFIQPGFLLVLLALLGGSVGEKLAGKFNRWWVDDFCKKDEGDGDLGKGNYFIRNLGLSSSGSFLPTFFVGGFYASLLALLIM